MIEANAIQANEKIQISVVIPAWNAEDYIAETIESVRSQTVKGWEMIVVDDCSTDRTAEIVDAIRKQDSRVGLVRLEKNRGAPAGPRNVGIRKAQGEWIAFLDSDDIWHPRKLEIQLAMARSNNADLICSEMRDFKELKEIEHPSLSIDSIRAKEIGYFQLFSKNIIPQSSVMVRKAVVVRVGYFNERPDYKAVEDFDLWLRIRGQGCSVIKVNVPLLRYRVVPTSISRSKMSMMVKVFRVLTHRLINDQPIWLPFLPYFFGSYIAQAIFTRFIKRAM